MRQRKVKNLEQKYEVYNDILVYEPSEIRGKWKKLAGDRPIYLEVGCGKGKFISELSALHPENFYIAVEGNRSVMLRAMEKIETNGTGNVVFIPHFIENLNDWFTPGEVDGIYLNFSDPLPKNYTAKKRLTHRDKLKQYFTILGKGGQVIFKTDNTGLFEFTIQEILASDLEIAEITRDLHNCPWIENIETEYEAKFSGLGENIKRVVIRRRNGEAKENAQMTQITSMAAYNGRNIPTEDKVFGASGRAKAYLAKHGHENTINATIGSLLDDDGNLIVLSSVEEIVHNLSGADFAEYAPIAGTPGFKKAVTKAALGNYEPNGFVKVVATPGGTGSIRNAIANYSCLGDSILTHNWHWGPYKSIAGEQGRSLETFEMFDEDGNFNLADFEYKVKKLTRTQDRLLIILNTPANNPTGYSLSMEDWYGVKNILDGIDLEKKIVLLVDVAYIDFAGETNETREFLSVIDTLRSNVLPIIAYSASKTFTFYGFRCAAMLCLAHNPEVAEEFERVCTFSSRASWSNSPRAPQIVIEKIYNDNNLMRRVDKERAKYREILQRRGKAFEEEAAALRLQMVPFRSGFFITIPYDNPALLCQALEKKGVFLIEQNQGVRVSVASISEDKCRKLPAIIKDTMDELAGVL